MQERKILKARRTLEFLKAEPRNPCSAWGCGRERGGMKMGRSVYFRTGLESVIERAGARSSSGSQTGRFLYLRRPPLLWFSDIPAWFAIQHRFPFTINLRI